MEIWTAWSVYLGLAMMHSNGIREKMINGGIMANYYIWKPYILSSSHFCL